MAEHRLVSVDIDEDTLAASGPDAEHERRVAIFDLLEENSFEVEGKDAGPYALKLLMQERKLVFEITDRER